MHILKFYIVLLCIGKDATDILLGCMFQLYWNAKITMPLLRVTEITIISAGSSFHGKVEQYSRVTEVRRFPGASVVNPSVANESWTLLTCLLLLSTSKALHLSSLIEAFL